MPSWFVQREKTPPDARRSFLPEARRVVVAGAGFEPATSEVMSLASYRTALPRNWCCIRARTTCAQEPRYPHWSSLSADRSAALPSPESTLLASVRAIATFQPASLRVDEFDASMTLDASVAHCCAFSVVLQRKIISQNASDNPHRLVPLRMGGTRRRSCTFTLRSSPKRRLLRLCVYFSAILVDGTASISAAALVKGTRTTTSHAVRPRRS